MAEFLVFHPKLDVYGGSEKVCHNIIKTLVAHDQNVQLLTFDFDRKKYHGIMGDELPKTVIVHSIEKKIENPPFSIYKRHHNIAKLFKKFRRKLKYDFFFSTQASSPFEPVFLSKSGKNIGYVHFPEIHFEYERSTLKRRIYLWLFKKWIEKGIKKLDLIFCNSKYSKEEIVHYWGPLGIQDPIIVRPPINLGTYWCEKPIVQRSKRIVYIGRFIPTKRHEILKKIAMEFPRYEFVSIGGLQESEKEWFNKFSENIPRNYILKPNLANEELIRILQDSRLYVHLMEGEHFGISPIEALASGCITLVHDSGGIKEFIPREFRWKNSNDLKRLIAAIEIGDEIKNWEVRRQELWKEIETLSSKNFQNNIWSNIHSRIQQ